MTPTEFRAAVLLELAVTAAGETADGDDDQAIIEAYARLHAEYAKRDRIWWNLDDDVPDEAGDAMIIILADRTARKFGLPDARRLELKADAVRAVRQLAAVAHEGMDTTSTSVEYF